MGNPARNMSQAAVFEFLERYSSLIITTHDPADPDGLGAEKIFSLLIKSMGKIVHIVNSGPIPENYRFTDPEAEIKTYADIKENIPRGAALVILDTTDEYNIGEIKEIIPHVPEVFVIDHHEPNQFCTFAGYIDSSASSTVELAVELLIEKGIAINPGHATAAYAGIVYDTGFFAYSKTTERTFRAALALVEAGVIPYMVYHELNESSSAASLLLQKIIFASLEIHNEGRVAIQMFRKEDLESSGARYEDAENFINMPMKCKDMEVSILVKENREGQVRCSLRSKGGVNVSKIAQSLGGGGHVAAAGFKSSLDPAKTCAMILEKVNEALGGKIH